MKHMIRHEEKNVERWVYDEGDVINAMIEKSGIPLIGNGGDNSSVTWDVSTSQAGIRSITITKSMTTTDGERDITK
jgi:hypothetical protein